jgi:hypothetical protein
MRQDLQLRCRSCQAVLPGWLRVQNRPDGAMLLTHVSAMHQDQVGPYRRRMETEDIGTVAMVAFKRVEEQDEAS